MNPKPSIYQCLVLHEIQDGRVFWRDGHWWDTGAYRDHKVTSQVEKLEALHMIWIEHQFRGSKIHLTTAGLNVIARRPLAEILEQLNRQ